MQGRQLEESERQLGRVYQQLEAAEQRVAELEQQLSQREQQNPEASIRGKELTSFKLRWRKGKRAPYTMFRYSDAVVDGNMVYVKNGATVEIYSYDVTTDSWSQLPNCAEQYSSLTIINGWLTTVGGGNSNNLFSLTGKGNKRRWTKKFPPMPTKRQWTATLCTGTALIVAGGRGGDGALSTVEVMNTETLQWSIADNLPQAMYWASATVCGDCIYMLGGQDKHWNDVQSVYTCSVSALLQSCVPSAKVERTSLVGKASVWRQVTDSPVTRSTCESFHGQLLAIGGREDSGKPTTAVHMYNSITNSWEIISHMTTVRYRCFTAVLPSNQLMVVGGWSGEPSVKTDMVEVASLY